MLDWGVSTTTVGRLHAVGAPYSILLILAYLRHLHGPISRDLDLVELFSGCGQLVAQFRRAGLSACPYDKELDPDSNDFTSCTGLLHAAYLVPCLDN